MRESEHFGLNLVEGTDLVNPLTQDVPNYEAIDEQMFKNESAGVGTANELTANTVHAITRINGNTSVFRFTATSRYNYGDTFTVDGVSVSAVAPNGTALVDGAYIVGGTVLCSLVGQLLTVYTIGKATDSEKLGGELPDYYAKDSELEQTSTLVQLTSTIANKNAEDIVELNNKINGLFVTLTGTTPSATGDLVLAYPSGYDKNNTIILGSALYISNSWYWSNDLSINYPYCTDAGIKFYVNNSLYYNKSAKVVIAKG